MSPDMAETAGGLFHLLISAPLRTTAKRRATTVAAIEYGPWRVIRARAR